MAETSQRCGWCGSDPIYVAYHDTEWGVPERDSRALWEKLILDGFQAGLSWITILKKRDAFREEFDGFDPEAVARWDAARVERALANPGIVRHRGKITSAISNAQAFLELSERSDFAEFLWSFTGGEVQQPNYSDPALIPTQTPESVAMSRALKEAGFRFCGPTIVYAFMEASGLVNDHLTTCPRHPQLS